MANNNRKANDRKVPKDELLLAEAIAAAEAHDMEGCTGTPFITTGYKGDGSYKYGACCAVGALALIRTNDVDKAAADAYSSARTVLNNTGLRRWDLQRIWTGNDCDEHWDYGRGDGGESFGWAFRNAMGA